MKTTTTAAIDRIAKQMIRTAPEGFDVEPVAVELFYDLAEATRDFILAGRNGLDYAATAMNQLGFAPIVASNLARAVLVYLDNHGRTTTEYKRGVVHALEVN